MNMDTMDTSIEEIENQSMIPIPAYSPYCQPLMQYVIAKTGLKLTSTYLHDNIKSRSWHFLYKLENCRLIYSALKAVLRSD